MHRWFPWRYLITRMARAQGFIDPLSLYARLQQFAQPSEVAEPIELLRAGAVFHARGLINSRVIQHNLDWVWPYWAERQFDPADVSFLPRAFSLTHVNLTHRNWTAVGLPGRDELPIVDPRGLLTPNWDGWSIDVWCMDDDGDLLLPSRAQECEQSLLMGDSLSVRTVVQDDHRSVITDVEMVATESGDVCRLSAQARQDKDGWLIVSARPCNPEGVSFIDHVALDAGRRAWLINDRDVVRFSQLVDRHHVSNYHEADVRVHLNDRVESDAGRCNVGMVTAAALFRLEAKAGRRIHVDIPIKNKYRHGTSGSRSLLNSTWSDALASSARLQVPDELYVRLYDTAVRTLVLCTPDDAYAGPYTYKRYWYRDAVFIGHGLLCAGLVERVHHLVSRFPERQSMAGYFHSQAGEWDANGEVLWFVDRLCQCTGERPDEHLWRSLKRGADWIESKRLPDYGGQAHEGLLPAGFSAEHLGPNDHYYWDNYWALAGLKSAARLARMQGDATASAHYLDTATKLQSAIERSLVRLDDHPGSAAIPAAPTRRMDAGAIGSVVVSYPLQLCMADDHRLTATLEFLLKHCFHEQGFFQDMIHSGVNAYLTLHVAQALMRKGDHRYQSLVRRIAHLASPTGHWPEAVHPHTGGGCMGDGHHAWAAAEWVAVMRNAFLVEEGELLVLGSGLLPEWLGGTETVSFGPAPTRFGTLTVTISPSHAADSFSRPDHAGSRSSAKSNEAEAMSTAVNLRVQWQGLWNENAPAVQIRIPGFHSAEVCAESECREVVVRRILS